MKDIPVHQLKDRIGSGLEVKHFVPGDIRSEEVAKLGAHRDDHYIFFLVESGVASLMIDFHELSLQPSSIYYILPGQVHHRIRAQETAGWFLAIDTLLIPPDYRDVFENQLLLQQPFALNEKLLNQSRSLLCMLEQKHYEDEQVPFNLSVVHSLLQSFLGIAVGGFSSLTNPRNNLSRPAQLSQEFKKLLVINVRIMKSPSAYASELNVSESYLNEALKKVTGFSVSYWIQHEVVLEAKWMLYYTSLSVKEIAHLLGYEDHTYFSRLFKKFTDITPLSFRSRYRK
jgi:AraC family transcriptional regulator, transcriptional activator of pobA